MITAEKFNLSDEAKKEIDELAKAYTDKHHSNASWYLKVKVIAAFVEAYQLGLQHALTVAMDELK